MNQLPSDSVQTSNRSCVISIIKGLAAAMMLCIVIFAVAALVMLFSPLPDRYTRVITIVTSILSIVIGAVITARSYGSKGWLWGGIMGLSFIMLLYIIGMLTVTGFVFDTYVVTMLISGFIAGGIGGIIGTNMRRPGRRRRR